MTDLSVPTRIQIGPQGRVVIPAALRKAVGIDVGDTLIAQVDDGRIVLEKTSVIVARLRERFRAIPADVNLADELIAHRRAEALAEGTE